MLIRIDRIDLKTIIRFKCYIPSVDSTIKNVPNSVPISFFCHLSHVFETNEYSSSEYDPSHDVFEAENIGLQEVDAHGDIIINPKKNPECVAELTFKDTLIWILMDVN